MRIASKCLATKGIVFKTRLIKDFLKYFDGEDYLFSIFFFSDEKIYHDVCIDCIIKFINGNLVVFMVTQERMGSPEAEVIYFASTTYHH